MIILPDIVWPRLGACALVRNICTAAALYGFALYPVAQRAGFDKGGTACCRGRAAPAIHPRVSPMRPSWISGNSLHILPTAPNQVIATSS
jgi:hypothetical protein